MMNDERMSNDPMTIKLSLIPNEIEESRGETEEQFRGILRLLPRLRDSLRMTICYSDFVIVSSFVIRHSSFAS
jgi:hypothetical protein